jgi:LmbE family N-acetylglucosaminyl deacetylase
MKKYFLLSLLVSLLFQHVFGQAPIPSSGIMQNLNRLNVLGSVLYIAAHPDDENTRLLTYLNKERNFRTAYLSLTRGDGGQNLVGKEQGEMLGLLRTQELLAARKIDGAGQYFTRANDFGYSKNPEETFSIWNKDSILADVVWVIRNFRPDVIICRFPTTGEGGHGHHTASAILALEAFDAAADPKKFSWQLKYTTVWQTKRLFWNTFNFGGTNTTSPDQLQIDVGGYNPLLGKSYGEIAAESRSMHKSQGFGSAKTMGSTIEYFKQLKGDSAKIDLFEGIDVSWNRIPGASSFTKNIDECIKNFNTQKPFESLPKLVTAYSSLQQFSEKDEITRYWKKQKLKEMEALLFDCAGLWMEVSANNFSAIPGSKIEFQSQLINRSSSNIKVNKISWNADEDTLMALSLKPNVFSTFKHIVTLPASIPYSSPYWLNETHDEGFFTVKDQTLIGKAENSPAVYVAFDITIEGLNLKVERPVVYKSVDPIKGEVYRPFEIIPPATVNFSSKAFVFMNKKPGKLQLEMRSNTDSLTGKLQLMLPDGWQANPDAIDFGKLKKNEEKIFETTVTPSKDNSTGIISAAISSGNTTISKSIHRLEYDHIPYQFKLTDAKAKVTSLDLKLAGMNIGYIPGAGDDVADNLLQLGYNVTMLPKDILAKKDLSEFDAIVTGVRAFNTNEWLQDFDKKLLQYVKQGGNLIIQYNTNNRIGPLTARIFPYPFTISRERVTDENAEVRILNPNHPCLNYPNKITSDDFKGWIQERGIYFATEVDSSYQKIFSMNDAGEKPQEGSLIVGKYGKGNFVYTGLVFFREMPAGIPGAYRLFVNLLSLPKNN